MPAIKNLLFDLGGVIINLDQRETVRRFAFHAKTSEQVIDSNTAALMPHLKKYETGAMDNLAFLEGMRAGYPQLTDQQITDAWNAMLLDLPPHRIDMLRELRKNYPMVLFSNTNSLHIEAFNKILKTSCGLNSLDSLFDKVYFSHLVKRRKPDPETFRWILDDNGWKAEETLAIDDTPANIQSAQSLGMRVYQVEPNKLPADFLKYVD